MAQPSNVSPSEAQQLVSSGYKLLDVRCVCDSGSADRCPFQPVQP